MMGKDSIMLRCEDCGQYVSRPEYCPYTGHRHAEGWVYKCTCCNGNMKEVEYRNGGACSCLWHRIERAGALDGS